MLRLIGLVVSIGIADSLNPTTIAPALYLAAGDGARRQLAEFTAAVFAVYLLGGLVIALGPGELLLAVVPRPGRHLSYLLETVAGAAMLTAAAFLWGYREKLAQNNAPEMKVGSRSSALLGATITAVELPTAFPYFGALAAIVGSGLGFLNRVFLLVLFNVCFVLPLIGIILVLEFAPGSADAVLGRARDFMQRHWPVLLAVVAIVAGGITIALGATGTWRQARMAFRKAVSAAT